MKVYLAAGFNRKNEIASYARELQALGVEVTARWMWENAAPNSQLVNHSDAYLSEHAQNDIDDIVAADALILFTHDPKTPFLRGGRMHEAGYAHALGKELIICGPKENIFHYLPEVKQYETWEELCSKLKTTILPNLLK